MASIGSILLLPKDVLVYMFQMLDSTDVARCARTCKNWYRCTLDPSFSWIAVATKTLEEQRDWGLRPDASNTYEEARERKRSMVGAAVAVTLQKGELVMVNTNGDLVAVVDHYAGVSSYTHPPIYYPLIHKEKVDSTLMRVEIVPARYHPGSCYPNAWHVRLLVNTRKLETYLRSGKEILLGEWLVQQLVRRVRYELFPPKWNAEVAYTPLDVKDRAFDQPVGFSSSLQLHRYQRAAVHWMRSVELDVNKGLKYCPLYSWRGVDALFNLDTGDICTVADGVSKFSSEVKYRGGVLADQMGLGKTLEVIGLIMANTPKKEQLERKEKGLLPSKATLVLCPNHLVKQWADEFEKHTTGLNVISITLIKEQRALSLKDLCEADVVIVSYNFLLNNNYNSAYRTVPDQLDRIDRLKEEMRKNQSVNMAGSACLEQIQWYRLVLDEAHQSLADKLLSAIVPEFESIYRWYVSGTPFPDEDLLEAARAFLRDTPAEWDRSLPHEKKEIPWKSRKRLPQQPAAEIIRARFRMGIECDLLLSNLYWRNTRASVESDWKIPELKQRAFLIDFHPVEQLNYEYERDGKVDGFCDLRQASDEDLLRLCSVQKMEGEEERETLVTLHKQLKKELMSQVEDATEQLPRMEAELAEAKTLDPLKLGQDEFEKKKSWHIGLDYWIRDKTEWLAKHLESCERRIQHKQEVLRLYTPILHRLQAVPAFDLPAEYYEELEQKHREEEDSLEYASEDSDDKRQKQKKRQAAQKKKQKTSPSPTKASKRKKSSAARRTKGKKGKKETAANAEGSGEKKDAASDYTDSSDLQNLILRLGSKPAHLIAWMKRLFEGKKDARVILFSQFDAALKGVEELLDEFNFPTTYCYGNIIRKNNALAAWKTDDACRVILLSSSRLGAGLNLMEASHVVLLDPMGGTKERARATEAQAIARAFRQGQTKHVTVVRFVIRNTLDYTLYLRNTQSEGEKSVSVADTQLTGRSQSVRTTSMSALLANTAGVATCTPATAVPLLLKRQSTELLLKREPTASTLKKNTTLSLTENDQKKSEASASAADSKETKSNSNDASLNPLLRRSSTVAKLLEQNPNLV